jgi:hypothetical protein
MPLRQRGKRVEHAGPAGSFWRETRVSAAVLVVVVVAVKVLVR